MTPLSREFPVVRPPAPAAVATRRLLLALAFLAAVLALLWALPSGAEGADDCGPFERSLPRPTGVNLMGLAVGGDGVLVAVGDEGTIVRSADGGVDWVTVRTEPGTPLHDVAWTGARFVAVGFAGRILESADGLAWRDVSPVPSPDLWAVAARPGRVVAVGSGGTVFTSPDGVAWTFVPLPEVADSWSLLYDVATDGAGFLAVGTGGYTAESPDGLAWRVVDMPGSEFWYAVTAAAGGWVAISANGAARRGADGSWIASPWPPNYWLWEPTMDVVALPGGELLATGITYPEYPAPPRRSTDGGLSWTTVDATGYDDGLSALAVRPGGDLLGTGPFGRIARSEDGGRRWTDLAEPGGASFSDVALGGGRFVATGEPSGSEGTRASPLASSTDGWLWQAADLGRDDLAFDGVAWNGSRWLATGFDGTRLGAVAATSGDGLAWTLHDLPLAGRLSRPQWRTDRWIASFPPHVASSPDGVAWTVHRVDVPDPDSGLGWSPVYDLATNGTTTVAVTSRGDLVASSDLDHWAPRHLGGTGWSMPIAFGAGRFVVPYRHESSGTIRVLVSGDTFTWYDQASPIDPDDGLARLTWDGSRFVLGTWLDAAWESADGTDWRRVELPMPIEAAAASTSGRRVAVGIGGIAVADCAPLARPDADFATSPASPEVGEPVSFVARSTGRPSSLAWSFGDGGAATGPAPRHAFAAPGDFAVTLVASNGAGSAATTRTVTVRAPAPPLAAFDVAPQPAVVGHPILFRDRSTGRVGEREWRFGDGVTGTGADVTRVFLSPGLVRVTLVVRNDAGESRVTKPVRVLPDGAACAGATWLDDATRGRTLRRLAATGERLVAVGDEGMTLSSVDGVAWTASPVAIEGEGWQRVFVGAATDGHSFLAVTSEEVWASPDGATWSRAAAIPGAFLQGIAFARGRWFALGRGIWSSEDGFFWAERFVPFSGAMFGALADDGQRLVAVGGVNAWYSAFGTAATSTDGVTWVEADLGGRAAMLDVLHDGGRFVAVGNSWLRTGPQAEGWTSSDGIAWTRLAGIPAGFMPSCVARSGADLLLGGFRTEGIPRPGAVARLAGAGFVLEELPEVPPVLDLEPFAGQLVAVGGTGALLRRGSAGRSWVEQSDAAISVLHDVVAPAGAPRVAVGNRAILVEDAGRWRTSRVEPDWPLTAVAAGNDRFLAVGRDTLATSPDGVSWTEGILPNEMPAVDVTFAGGRFVVVAADGTSAVSTDGVDWSTGALPPADVRVFRAVAAGDDRLVGVGAYGLAATSPDGLSWTRSDAGTSHDLMDVAFGHGRFVAVGSAGAIVTSRDGARWDWHGLDELVYFEKVVATPHGFAAIASDGTGQQRGLLLYTSPDGESWSAAPEPLPLPPWGDLEGHGLAADGDRLLVVGPGGTVLSVDCAGRPTTIESPPASTD